MVGRAMQLAGMHAMYVSKYVSMTTSGKIQSNLCAHHPISSNVLDALLELSERLGGVIGDRAGNGLLATGVQGHLVTLLHQLPCQIQADEAGATWRCWKEGSVSAGKMS